jgi:hypothetical protein
MSDRQQGLGWWLASDGKWYPPESMPTYFAPPPQPGYVPALYPPPESRLPVWLVSSHVSGWAVGSGYLGPISLIFLGIPGPIAILTGILGLRQIKRNPDLNGKVRAWVGIVFGILGTALNVLFLVDWLT